MAKYKIPYFKDHVEVEIPDSRVAAVLTSKTESYQPKLSESELVR